MTDAEIKNTPLAPEDVTGFRQELGALFKLGLPMALAQIAQMSILTIDLMMIGRIGIEDVAAMSLALVIYFSFWMLGLGPASAITPMAAQSYGQNKNNVIPIRQAFQSTTCLILIVTPIVFLITWHTDDILRITGQDAALADKAARYIRILMLGYPFALCVMVMRGFLNVLGRNTVPLIIIIAANALNVFLNWVLIFGHFGIPRLELEGAAIASVISTIIAFLAMTTYSYHAPLARQFQILHNFVKGARTRLKEAFTLSWPISLATLFEGMLFNACVLLAGRIGTDEVAAYQIALNLASLAFMLAWGMSMAGSARIGLAAGAGAHPAMTRVSLSTFILSVVAIACAGIPMALFPEFITRLYIDPDVNVGKMVISFLPIAVAFMLFDATQVAANQLLRGLKDVTLPMWITGFSYWICGFSLAYYLGLHSPLGILGVWYGLLIGLAIASLLLSIRLYWVIQTRKSSLS